MFGIGGQELMMIVMLLLVIFGPAKVGRMAGELGRFAYKARASMDELKEEFSAARDPHQGHKGARNLHSEHRFEVTHYQSSTQNTQTLLAAGEDNNDGSLPKPPEKDTSVAGGLKRVPPRDGQ
jgi:Sec-independent protein translocase protein TatA